MTRGVSCLHADIPLQGPGPAGTGLRHQLPDHPVSGAARHVLLEVTTKPLHGEALLFLTEVAAELGLSVRTVQRLCESGALQSCIPAREHRRVKRRWLEDYKRARGLV